MECEQCGEPLALEESWTSKAGGYQCGPCAEQEDRWRNRYYFIEDLSWWVSHVISTGGLK